MRLFDPNIREVMDLDQPVSPALERDLANLATLNRVFGSHALVLAHLRPRLRPGRAWRVLDLATGSGDIPRVLSAWAARAGVDLAIDAVDQQPATLTIARRLSAAHPAITYHEGDIRTFGAGRTWDVVLCSLALHHFSDADATAILRHVAALTARHALVADLRRSVAGTLGVDLLTATWMREPMTVHDARLSVRRAFSFAEFAALARAAAWPAFGHARRFCFRQALWFDR